MWDSIKEMRIHSLVQGTCNQDSMIPYQIINWVTSGVIYKELTSNKE